jgi:phosphoribosylglycinamide formyltransferase 2
MVFTTPLQENSIKIMLLGSGELGKEVAIEAQRLGLEVVAVDSYKNAPAHQVAHKACVVNMKSKAALLRVIKREAPTHILPEVEAINIEALFEAEKLGITVIPNAEAVNKTMNRKNIREFAAENLGVKTSGYAFVKTEQELKEAALALGFPCVIKPVMSSSGHGQSVAKKLEDLGVSYEKAKEARGDASELIVEEFIEFDYEITLLTAYNGKDVVFCEPIGHKQKDEDYILSWQPMPMSKKARKKAQNIAKKVVLGLGVRGIYGVELFIKGDEVYFSEVSPRPHDTGMVTMITQSISEFGLHIRAVLGLPLKFRVISEGASAAFKATKESETPRFELDESLLEKDVDIRFFGKPVSHNGRRMGVVLVASKEAKKALKKAKKIVAKIEEV